MEEIKQQTSTEASHMNWTKAAKVSDFPQEGGSCVLLKDEQIAIFNFSSKGEWFATQNLCPHKQQMILSRGMIGDAAGTPKVACPFHKKQFSLESGECLDDDTCESIKTYPVKIEDGYVHVAL